LNGKEKRHASDGKLVCERVDNLSQLRNLIELPGGIPVDQIGEAGGDDEGSEEPTIGGTIAHQENEDRHDKDYAQEGQDV